MPVFSSLLPRQLPDLPAHTAFRRSVQDAYQIIKHEYERSTALLFQDDSDPLRLKLHCEDMLNRTIPLFVALIKEESGITDDWALQPLELLYVLVTALSMLSKVMSNQGVDLRDKPSLVNVVRTMVPGRPSKVVSEQWLTESLSPQRRIPYTRLATILGIHRNTLRKYRLLYNIRPRFSVVEDEELDELIHQFKAQRPESGLRYLIGYLQSKGVRIQKERVRVALARIDGLGLAIRRYSRIDRRPYSISLPNKLWHIDGHHKLITWGIVVHGIVDGYCRTIVGMRAAVNNTADTVLQLFVDAVAGHGFPSRVRGDRGGENMNVAIYMIMRRGAGRGSFLWGSSTRNTPIERMWREAGSQCIRRWRAFFIRLEKYHGLSREDACHLWLVQLLFLQAINDDLRNFIAWWNSHPISGRQTQNQSPSDMRFLGFSKQCPADEGPDIHPSHFTTHAAATRGSALDELVRSIADGQDQSVRHEGVEVPSKPSPFQSEESFSLFVETLMHLHVSRFLPPGFLVRDEEWGHNGYPASETIYGGNRGKKAIHLDLPPPIWLPRAILWSQALTVMRHVLAHVAL